MLNIPREIYFAWDTSNSRYELPEATVVPGGDALGEKKKLVRVTKDFSNIKECKNIPLPGFTLYKTPRRLWGAQPNSWTIIDPRGFIVNISTENLDDILHVTGITEGLIQAQCVWARVNSQTKLCLIPESSALYKDAVSNTLLIEDSININSVDIGDTILLQNGLIGKYLGQMSLYGGLDYRHGSKEMKPISLPRRHLLEVSPGVFHHQTKFSVIRIDEKSRNILTKDHAVKMVNDAIRTGNTAHPGQPTYFTNSTNMVSGNVFTRDVVVMASTITTTPTISLVEISKKEFESHLLLDSNASSKLLLECDLGKQYTIAKSYYNSAANDLKVCDVESVTEHVINLKVPKSLFSYSFSDSHTLSDFKKFYEILKHIKNTAY